MRDTWHSGVATRGCRAVKDSIPNLLVLSLLLCLAGLTAACGTLSQGANGGSTTTSEPNPAGQLRISPPPTQATVGVAYNAVSSVSGGTAPYVFGIADGSLPPGLIIDSRTGSITGMPSVAGTYNFVLYVSPLSGKEYGSSLAHIVVSAGRSLTVLSISPSSATVASQGQQQFTARISGTANTAVTWSASVGTISSSGAFTAPKVTSNTSVTITATSVAEPSSHAAATVTVTPRAALGNRDLSPQKGPTPAYLILPRSPPPVA